MIRDTSGQDVPLARPHGRRRLWLALAGAGLLIAAFAAAPAVKRAMSEYCTSPISPEAIRSEQPTLK